MPVMQISKMPHSLDGVPGADREDRPLGEAFLDPTSCRALCRVQTVEGAPYLEQVGKTEPEEDAGSSQPPEEKSFLCSDCGKAFAWRKNLASHQRLHAEGGHPFSCAECGFAHRAGLAAHQCGGHTGKRPFACNECGRCFAHKRHLRSTEKPFPCSVCGKSFSQRPNLITHQRIHTGEKPFSCTECGKRFNQRANLITHRRIHSGERPFPCATCGRRFSQKGNLAAHQRTHSQQRPHACSSCPKRFKGESALRAHQRTHRQVLGADPLTSTLLAAPTLQQALPGDPALVAQRATPALRPDLPGDPSPSIHRPAPSAQHGAPHGQNLPVDPPPPSQHAKQSILPTRALFLPHPSKKVSTWQEDQRRAHPLSYHQAPPSPKSPWTPLIYSQTTEGKTQNLAAVQTLKMEEHPPLFFGNLTEGGTLQ
uniref:C2H2-type domain-containing protein n=1 Tax=Pseudonaja textilis TaxID=8673 RepID=A0A670ZW99_PSETE